MDQVVPRPYFIKKAHQNTVIQGTWLSENVHWNNHVFSFTKKSQTQKDVDPLDPGVPSFSYIKDPTGEPYSGMLAVYPPGGRVWAIHAY